jgi:hypothetical protein
MNPFLTRYGSILFSIVSIAIPVIDEIDLSPSGDPFDF